jgi:hypothetical protein
MWLISIHDGSASPHRPDAKSCGCSVRRRVRPGKRAATVEHIDALGKVGIHLHERRDGPSSDGRAGSGARASPKSSAISAAVEQQGAAY